MGFTEAHFFLPAILCRRRIKRGCPTVGNKAGDIGALVERTVTGLGYDLVDLERAGGGLLRVTIDVPGDGSRLVAIEDCERVSNQLTRLFAVEMIDYQRLEVSSPGLDRPLRRVADYRRFAGAQIEVQLHAAFNGRKRWTGRLLGLDGEEGSEKIRLQPSTDRGASGKAGATRAKPKAVKAVKATGVADASPAMEFLLADVDKARVVPELDFRSKR
jgi:ribosome maturation factor RimP